MGFLSLREGDWVVITVGDGEESSDWTVQWCESQPVLVGDNGEPYLQYYEYEPDGVTDLIRMRHVLRVRLLPLRQEPADDGGR